MAGPPSLAHEGRLAIIAGRGRLPVYIAEAARSAGDDPLVITLKNEADARFDGFETVSASVGDLAGIESAVKASRVRRVVMSGGVSRRPDWRDIHPTARTLLKIPFVLRTLLSGGDDAVLQMVIGLLEAMGCRVVGAHEIAPGLLARTGPLGAHVPSPDDVRDIDKAVQAALKLGELDIGQGAVSVGGRVVALEGVEGTDQMLERVAGLRQEGRISARRRGAIVKLCKPHQDMRADLPTIGPSTVTSAKKAGLAGIAIEAGRALILDEDALVAAADEAGIFVFGIDVDLAAEKAP